MASGGPTRFGLVAMGAVAALVGLVTGIGIVTLSSRTTEPSPPDIASMDEVAGGDTTNLASLDEVAPAGASEPLAEPTPSEPVDQADTTGSDQQSTGALDSCEQTVADAHAAVDAARVSLANWKTHYGAQIAFDKGQIDGDEAKKRWADSKAPAEDNINAFVAARNKVPGDDPCAGADGDQLDDEQRRRVDECVARTTAAAEVLTELKPAMKGWRAHLEMMATRENYPVEEYLQIWRQAVADAPAPMKAFEEALGAYDKTDGCDVETAATGADATPSLDTAPVTTVATVSATPSPICLLADPRNLAPI